MNVKLWVFEVHCLLALLWLVGCYIHLYVIWM